MPMKTLLLTLALFAGATLSAQTPISSQWEGKRVAFLGDSITDTCHVGTTKNYWGYLADLMDIKPMVYGINGHQWDGVYLQAQQLHAERGDALDAILIFAGTNDFNSSVPLGQWYSFHDEPVAVAGGKTELRRKRTLLLDPDTFRGRINRVIDYLKTTYPTKQIILLSPIHRGYAKFGEDNVQPTESFPNRLGLYIDDYVQAVKEASAIWSVPVIDLYSLSGLLPSNASFSRYVHDETTDRLHPNAEGHLRMAKTLMYQLLALPASF